MKTKTFALPEIWTDCFVAAGVVAFSAILGFYAREFAALTQANLFFTDWGFF